MQGVLEKFFTFFLLAAETAHFEHPKPFPAAIFRDL
jgi:hypothetical protein